MVKKTLFNAYDSSLQAGLIAINLREGDELVRVIPTSGDDEILLVSQTGQGIRFAEADVRSMGRTAAGVRGMKLQAGDEVVGAAVVADGPPAAHDHRRRLRQAHRRRPVQPRVAAARACGPCGSHADKGHVVAGSWSPRTTTSSSINDSRRHHPHPVASISVQGRDATGVRVMNLDDETQVVAVARVRGDRRGRDATRRASRTTDRDRCDRRVRRRRCRRRCSRPTDRRSRTSPVTSSSSERSVAMRHASGVGPGVDRVSWWRLCALVIGLGRPRSDAAGGRGGPGPVAVADRGRAGAAVDGGRDACDRRSTASATARSLPSFDVDGDGSTVDR